MPHSETIRQPNKKVLLFSDSDGVGGGNCFVVGVGCPLSRD